MEEWTKIKARPTKLPGGDEGLHIDVFVSPFDVPTHARGYLDSKTGRFVIQLKYIGDEPYQLDKNNEHLHLRIGKNSGRLYGVEVDVKKIDASSVGLRVLVPQVVQSDLQAVSPDRPDRRGNFELARQALQGEESSRLYDALGAG